MNRFLKRTVFTSISMVFCALGSYAQTNGGINARDLIQQIETQYEGKSSHAMMTLSVITEDYARDLTMESWSEGRDKFLTVIRQPEKERGTATLKVGDNMWNYLPRIDRLIKIPSSLMGDSWMGSHLTNDDLVKESKIDSLYTFTVESTVGDTVTILCTPRPNAAVVWDRILYRVDLNRKVSLDTRYYDEKGSLVRTMTFTDMKQVSGRWLPMKLTVQPADKPNERTTITYQDITFDINLPANYFSVDTLRRL